MTRTRLIRTGGVVLAIALVQGALVLVYVQVEREREAARDQSFLYERIRGEPLRDLILVSPDGNRRALADLRGKPVLLHFWATWCPPCRDELPGLLELAREEKLQLVALTVDEDWTSVRTFFEGDIPSEVVRDATGAAAAGYEVSNLPDTYLLDAQGWKRLRFAGARDWQTDLARMTLRREIERQSP